MEIKGLDVTGIGLQLSLQNLTEKQAICLISS